MFRSLTAVMIVLGLPVLASAECLTTLPPSPAFVPPAPYPNAPMVAGGGFWYGTDSLWTNVAFNATWNMRDNVGNGKFYRTKLVYYRWGTDWRTDKPELIVTAKRIGGEAPLVQSEKVTAASIGRYTLIVMTAINIPTVGCWEITGDYKGHLLSFVVSVEP